MKLDPLPDTRRRSALARLTDEPLDLLVVGGGIVGSGVARDAAMRGLRVGLVDRHDFAAGTSSRSSRLLHGGLRYLAQGRLGLVHEASVEKKIVHHIAPHLAEPLGFIFPAYRGEGPPMWQLRIGIKVYDLLCGGRNFQPSRGLSREETLRLLPALKADRLGGAVRYFDALTNDARLTIDTLRSAERHGAIPLNYARFRDASRTGAGWLCTLEDRLTGDRHEIRATAIVNATGPWADGLPHSAVKLRLTKGIHLVVDRARLPVPSAVVITEGKRLLFVLPWGERVILGTTDTDYRGAPEDVAVDPDDVAYVLRTVNEYFPSVALREADLVGSWAGLRPLVANPDGSPSDVSRAYEIRSPEPGWWDITGGKLTTYRLMAEQAVDRVVRHLGVKTTPSRTALEPLLPASEVTPLSGILPAPFERAAVEHYVRHEWAVHLVDVMERRSGWLHSEHPSAGRLEQVATWMAETCGWSAQRRATEIASCLAAESYVRDPGSPRGSTAPPAPPASAAA
jgi:glycerol-3-phosphate dehydrogenase